ncbi:ATP-dependent zinc protease [Pseudomonas nitroreducens]|uniref:ATP-dependent zinc protease n=1 Tax=Pseudomonas nitroreducens TaxID=46680 RepID=A0ABS0KR19_PSENT|nr:ATP-dependent zinc protease [Pseudomonas nitroreducens]MBG6289847.1 ATP-dependent zinc protease [Pseudomonas nitroreducens]MDG9857348.1 ATP-dependent zinc protease [Pseudomonas nitroreducens]MDH1076558.1 ATP-dependent zinc protease [Pseudomonas nitroreducens]
MKRAVLFFISTALVIPTMVRADNFPVNGWVEEVKIYPEGVPVKAKLDTGALTSSMDARNIEYFEKDSKKWVRFDVFVKNSDTGKESELEFERVLLRKVKVRGAGGADDRPVVKMQICIGNDLLNEEFSLRNRKNMIYPVLVGRKSLKNVGPVDVSKKFTREPDCNV